MLTNDDLIDALMEHLQGHPPKNGGHVLRPSGRPFLSEYDVRKLLAVNPKVLRIAKGTIVSPLAQDWLALRGVAVIEE